ncbi:lysophospholipase [Nisaea acidiphila]|uniref:Lysophospholipase n=1 Tax=Nisaea acidiphila TaxID=1862145 RepID=A0A9J7AX33_9PROT|nr:alpha/beta hydrolase [Nisaea acidiphila]UUX51840.1 lysophospholipase [Nisaea acidiphila]
MRHNARLRACLASLFLTIAAACAPGIAPRMEAHRPAEIRPETIVMQDGAHLPYKRWSPDGPAKAAVIALHGFNDYSGAYKDLAPLLAARGLLVFAYDQRGFGGTVMRGDWAGTEAMIRDLDTVTELLRAAYPELPVYALGESMGGAVIMAALGGYSPPRLDGAVLSAPAVWGRNTMIPWQRGALTAGAHLAPRIRVRPQSLPKLPSDNIEMLRRLYYDPMMIKETRVETAWGLTGLMDRALEAAPLLDMPLLVLYGREDGIIPRAPTCRMLRTLPTGADDVRRWRLALYENGYHMLFRDLNGGAVSADIAAWLADPAAPLPSGAEVAAPAGARPLPDFCGRAAPE